MLKYYEVPMVMHGKWHVTKWVTSSGRPKKAKPGSFADLVFYTDGTGVAVSRSNKGENIDIHWKIVESDVYYPVHIYMDLWANGEYQLWLKCKFEDDNTLVCDWYINLMGMEGVRLQYERVEK